MGDRTHTELPVLSPLDALSFYYDFRSPKFQNFEYSFIVKDKITGGKKVIKVWSTSEMVAKKELLSSLNSRFEI